MPRIKALQDHAVKAIAAQVVMSVVLLVGVVALVAVWMR